MTIIKIAGGKWNRAVVESMAIVPMGDDATSDCIRRQSWDREP